MDNFRHLRTFLEFYAHFWTFSSFAQVQKRTEEFLGDQNPSKSKMSSFGLKISFIRLKNLQKKVCNFYETKSKMSNFCLIAVCLISYSKKWKYLKYPQFFISMFLKPFTCIKLFSTHYISSFLEIKKVKS